MPPIYIAMIVGVIVFGAIVLVALIRSGADQEKAKKLAIISGRGVLRDDVNDTSVRDKRRAEMARKLKDHQEATDKKEQKATIRDMLIYAGLEVPQSYFWIGSALAGGLFLILSILMNLPIYAHLFLLIFGFFGLPRFVLKFMTGRRQKKFLEEFADGLESMVRLLKAGMPVGEAIAMVAREFSGPLGEEMGRVYESQRIGVPLGEAILDSARRMPLPEMRMFATGIIIQQQTGASLSEVLMNLAALIRARFRLRRKVQALSAEAKASAAIIGALPPFVAFGLWFINPNYINLLFITPTGKMMLAGAIGWMMIGILMMRQMINFKV